MNTAERLVLAGDRKSGQTVRSENVTAVSAIANIVKSSLGPVGLDKMLVDETGETTITNDGATILKLLDIKHPAAKLLAQIADQQDYEASFERFYKLLLTECLLLVGLGFLWNYF